MKRSGRVYFWTDIWSGLFQVFKARTNYNDVRAVSIIEMSLNQTSKKGPVNLLLLNYAYNKTGTVASVTGNVNGAAFTEQYSYDALNRLTNSLVQTGSIRTTVSYTYDIVGNRQSQTLNG